MKRQKKFRGTLQPGWALVAAFETTEGPNWFLQCGVPDDFQTRPLKLSAEGFALGKANFLLNHGPDGLGQMPDLRKLQDYRPELHQALIDALPNLNWPEMPVYSVFKVAPLSEHANDLKSAVSTA